MSQQEDVLLREFGITRRELMRRGGVAGGILLGAIPVIGTLYPRRARSAERRKNGSARQVDASRRTDR